RTADGNGRRAASLPLRGGFFGRGRRQCADEEAAVATEQLANQADHLSSRVAVFTLEEHEVARHESAQLQIAPVVS
ncbi:hypothetical protein ACUOA9_37890, partial [Escherichia sp. HC-TM1]